MAATLPRHTDRNPGDHTSMFIGSTEKLKNSIRILLSIEILKEGRNLINKLTEKTQLKRKCNTVMFVSFIFLCLSILPARVEPLLTSSFLSEKFTNEILEGIFPDATSHSPLIDNGPSAAAVFVKDQLVGYIFSTRDVLRARGYTGVEFEIIAGVDLEGIIRQYVP